ncbi:hypothetical protein [Helicobacter himalayensis]|uniref:hypothetical protein n=1 Tax=Helicobacter himalayensis TaxID=1591088 RepID=UPI0008328EE6|nr:hypothetical protein [Helicobacter himalayensis]
MRLVTFTLGATFGVLLFFSGCQDVELEAKGPVIPTCDTPKYEVLLPEGRISTTQVSAKKESERLFSKESFVELLNSVFKQSNCFSFTQNASAETFSLAVSYELKADEESQDINVLKSQDEISLKSLIVLDLHSKQKQITQTSNGELRISADRYFGLQNDNKLSRQDIKELLLRNLIFILNALK